MKPVEQVTSDIQCLPACPHEVVGVGIEISFSKVKVQCRWGRKGKGVGENVHVTSRHEADTYPYLKQSPAVKAASSFVVRAPCLGQPT